MKARARRETLMKPEMVRAVVVLVLLAVLIVVLISIPLVYSKLEPTQLLMTFASILVVIIMCWNLIVMSQELEEVRNDRRLEFLKERIEKFYTPLIRLFSHGTLHRGLEEHQEVEEIIVSRRHLCGRKLASILPPHFTATMVPGGGSFYFSFTEEEEEKKWEKIADTVWDEYVEILKEYYELIGVEQYMLPEKPKWMFVYPPPEPVWR